MLNQIMDTVMEDSLRPDFVKGEVHIPEGVDGKNLENQISEYFAEVARTGDVITYETPWLPF